MTETTNLDILIIVLEMVVPFVVLVLCSWRQETLKRNRRNEIIKTFFEFDNWED